MIHKPSHHKTTMFSYIEVPLENLGHYCTYFMSY